MKHLKWGVNPIIYPLIICCLFWWLVFCLLAKGCKADVDVNRLADAIKGAENSYNHPYGILKPYCKAGDPNGQCRKGCKQTIEKRLRLWDGKGDFIAYLGRSYAPIEGKTLTNDERRLNVNWVKNVKFFLKKDLPNG